MSKKSKSPAPALDATLPDVSLDLSGQTYHLVFTYAALSIAERKLKASGVSVNILQALDFREVGAEKLPILFFASLLHAQPDTTFEDAQALVTMKTFAPIFEKTVEAYVASMSDATEAAAEAPEDPTPEPTEA